MKYRLDAPHYINDQYLEAGTEVGDDTSYPLPEGFQPSVSMTGLDEDSQKEVDSRRGIDPMGEEALPTRGDNAVFRRMKELEAENLRLQATIDARAEPSGQEPFYPKPSVGPTGNPANIGLRRTEDGTMESVAAPPAPAEPGAEIGSRGRQSRIASGPVNPETEALPTERTREDDLSSFLNEGPQNTRPGDQPIENPNANMEPKDVDEARFSDPGPATGPVGTKKKGK